MLLVHRTRHPCAIFEQAFIIIVTICRLHPETVFEITPSDSYWLVCPSQFFLQTIWDHSLQLCNPTCRQSSSCVRSQNRRIGIAPPLDIFFCELLLGAREICKQNNYCIPVCRVRHLYQLPILCDAEYILVVAFNVGRNLFYSCLHMLIKH